MKRMARPRRWRQWWLQCPRLYRFLEIADSTPKRPRIWARPMTLPACPFTPRAGRPSCKKCWPRRFSKSRSAVSAILTGLRRLLWESWARFTKTYLAASGSFPISSCRLPMRRRLSRSFGILPSRRISKARSPRSSRSACLSSCRGSARSATVLCVTADFLSVTGMHRAIQEPRRKASSRRSSCSRHRRRGAGNSSRSMKAWKHLKTPSDWPVPGSDIEDWIFAASAVIFVEPTKSERAQQALRQALGGKRLEYLLALLAFIRAAHYWTMVHPGLKIEDDVRELMSSHKELAYLLLQDPDLADTDDLRTVQKPERLSVSI